MNAQDIMKKGFTGKKVGEILKQSKEWNEEEINSFLSNGTIPTRERVVMIPGSVWHWLCTNECFTGMFSRDNTGIASNSEKRRWLESGNIRVNSEFPKPDDKLEPVWDLVFFPGKRFQCTMV